MRSMFLIALLVPAFASQASSAQPTDAELADWTAFLRSLSVPVTVELCPALLPGHPDYANIAGNWLTAHEAQIERGREFARAGLPQGHDFDQYHAAMVADFKQKLLAKPESAQMKMCTETLNMLQKGPAAGGA